MQRKGGEVAKYRIQLLGYAQFPYTLFLKLQGTEVVTMPREASIRRRAVCFFSLNPIYLMEFLLGTRKGNQNCPQPSFSLFLSIPQVAQYMLLPDTVMQNCPGLLGGTPHAWTLRLAELGQLAFSWPS